MSTIEDRLGEQLDERRESLAYAAPEMHDMFWRLIAEDALAAIEQARREERERITAALREEAADRMVSDYDGHVALSWAVRWLKGGES